MASQLRVIVLRRPKPAFEGMVVFAGEIEDFHGRQK
jgi:hypothetical protein